MGTVTDQVLLALRRIIRAIDVHSRSLIHRYDMTGPQLAVLKELAECGPVSVSISQLASKVHLSHATVTGILGRLQKRGMIRRQRGTADKRRILVSLTPAAIELLSQGPPLLQDSFVTAFNGLAEWQQTQILSSLQRVVAMMEAGDLDATPMLATGRLDATAQQTKAFLDEEQQVAPSATADSGSSEHVSGHAGTSADTDLSGSEKEKGAYFDVCSDS